jgi:YVTN family beta-propeller protein
MKIFCFAANGFFSRVGSPLALAIVLLGAGQSLAQKESDEYCKRSFAYVGNEFSDSVSVIDTRNNHVVTNIPVPETAVGPIGVAIAPDGGNTPMSRIRTLTRSQSLKSSPIQS